MQNNTYTIFKDTDREYTGTISQISKHFKVDYNTLTDELERNSSLEKVINCNKTNKNCNHVGETKTMNCGMKCAIIEYINYNNITVRFEDKTIIKNKGYGAFKKGLIANPNLKFFTVFRGTDREFTGTIKKIAEHFNINYITLKYRINKKNLAIEDAINYKNNINNSFTIFRGTNKEFTGSMKEIAKHFNINYDTLKYRVKNQNLTMEEAVNYNVNDRYEIFTVFKNTSKEFAGNLRQIANNFNANYENIRCRIVNNNFSIEEAIEIPLSKVYQNDFSYKGKKGSIKELCKIFNKDYIEVYNKVKYNHTFEWAMGSTIKNYNDQ